ncbi:hypothetical protein [Mesorhizobium sp. CN2-181]|uniref:hypothetical protein n=1 Tax=Mesorhizobium yinganensis TaxID=3157707 RepID=UPI0032B7A9AC
MDIAAVTPGGRRGYRLSLAALAIALPAALLVESWGSVREWRARHERAPVEAVQGQPVRYAGAEWRLTRLERIAGGSPERTIMLAEFEAVPDDPAALAEVPCAVALTDGLGRQWNATFVADRVVRRAYPRAADKPGCGGPTFGALAKGAKAEMAATFVVPATADDIALSVTMASALPRYLRFSAP